MIITVADNTSRLAEFSELLACSNAVADVAEQSFEEARQVLSPAGLDNWASGAVTLHRLGRGDGPPIAWLRSMPLVARECGGDLLPECLSAAMKMSSMTSGEVISLTLNSLPGASRSLGDADLMRGYLVFLHQFAAKNARALRPMLMQMDELLSKLTLSGLRRWARFGAEAYCRDFNNLVSYFALESADSLAVLNAERRGVLLSRVQRKLNLYLRALWGRDFFIRPVGADHLDARPYLEQGIMHLPDAVDDLNAEIAGMALYRAAATHMAAHQMYTVESISAEALSPAQMYFIGLLEDARVEYCAERVFPGVRRLWQPLLEPGINDPDAVHSHSAHKTDTASAHSVEHALVLLKRVACMLGRPSACVGDDELNALVQRWHGVIGERCTDNRLSWHYGMQLHRLFAHRGMVPSLRLLEQLNIPYRDDNRFLWQFDGLSATVGSNNLSAGEQQLRRTVGLMELINEVDNELADDSAQEIWTCATELHPYEDNLRDTPSFNERWGREPVSDPYHYSEWDYRIQQSRPDWTSVYERRQARGDPDVVDQILQQYKPVSQRIRKIIDKLAPAGVQRLRNLEDGDEVDLNAAIEAMVAIRMGQQPSSRITLRNVLCQRDLAVVILMDLSESTNETLRGSEKTVLELTREAVALVATAIEGIGDSFAIHGFASDGRQDVQYYRFKDFNQSYDEEARARLAGMRGGLSTRMGAALRHAAYHVSRQAQRRKLILLLTDGEPADIDERDPQHLRHDAKKAVEELHTQGIYTYCLTLDSDADSYVRRIFGDSHYTIVDEVERLPEQLPVLFASLTG